MILHLARYFLIEEIKNKRILLKDNNILFIILILVSVV